MSEYMKDIIIAFLYGEWNDGVITWEEYATSLETIAGIPTDQYERF